MSGLFFLLFRFQVQRLSANMTALPARRAPSVNALSPRELTYETVGFDKVCIPVNAVIVAENELLFLETAQNLQDLKAVVIEKIGYVYFGRIHCRVVFLLKPRGPTAVIHAMKRLQPRAAIFLGFCKALQVRSSDSQGVSFEVGDVLIAETVLRKSSKYGGLESHPCSEYLVNVFEHGKFGWSPPKYRRQSAHVGSVVQMGDYAKNEKGTAIAEKSTKLGGYEKYFCSEPLPSAISKYGPSVCPYHQKSTPDQQWNGTHQFTALSILGTAVARGKWG